MLNPTAAMLVIGDEILSGRTRDANMHHLAGELAKVGIDLKEVRLVSDDADAITAAVNALRGAFDQVFTSGGIGPTHDDITADCIAAAFGAAIDVRDDARAIMQAHYDRQGIEMNAARLRMARIPDGAALIDNPISAAPGFSLGNVHVMAGVPAIFQAMVASVLPTLTGGAPMVSETVRLTMPEGEIAGPLGDLAKAHPELSIGSYPFINNGTFGANIVFRGTDADAVAGAASQLRAIFPGPPHDIADLPTLYRALDATWPAAGMTRVGPWVIRDGQGGGQRVAAATSEGDVADADIPQAEAAMTALGQPHLFMIHPGDQALDGTLDARGYRIKDPVVLYLAPISTLTATPVPRVSAFTIYPPLAIMADIWAAGGIGPARLAAMQRAKTPKTAILARNADQPAGAAFVAICENVAMIHAIEVTKPHRQQGVGANILRAAAHWAQDQGATHLALAVTRANAPANCLYTSLGMTVVGHYHYRIM